MEGVHSTETHVPEAPEAELDRLRHEAMLVAGFTPEIRSGLSKEESEKRAAAFQARKEFLFRRIAELEELLGIKKPTEGQE